MSAELKAPHIGEVSESTAYAELDEWLERLPLRKLPKTEEDMRVEMLSHVFNCDHDDISGVLLKHSKAYMKAAVELAVYARAIPLTLQHDRERSVLEGRLRRAQTPSPESKKKRPKTPVRSG